MSTTTLTAREFNQDVSKAKRAAEQGPVVITDRGQPAHVLLTYEAYKRLSGGEMSAAEAFVCEDGIDFDPPRLRDDILRPIDFD